MKKEIRFGTTNFEELGWLLVLDPHENKCSVRFELYEVNGLEGNNRKPVLDKYKRTGGETTNLEEACPQVSGRVEWDGSSHFYFGNRKAPGTPPDGYLHIDGTCDMASLLEALSRTMWECVNFFKENGKWVDDSDQIEFIEHFLPPNIKP